MNKKQFIALAVLVFMVIGLVGALVITTKPTEADAAPCKPCSTWGSIKTCFTDSPARCCSCEKNIYES